MSSSNLPSFDHSSGFKHTQPPNPNWTWGQRIETTPVGREWAAGEKDGWKAVDTSKEDPMKLYKLMISGIIPRPVAFVSTISESGVENLAPYSWFNMVSAYPLVISISCTNAGPAGVKDTPRNIKATKGFTVNIISEPWIENANISSVDAPPDTSEWPLTGLTKEPSVCVKAARVKESTFSMECELFQAIDIAHPETGKVTTTFILGLVKYVHVRNDMLNEKGVVDPARLRPISRLGDITYSRLGDGFRLDRPTWAQDGEKVLNALNVPGVENY